MKITTPNKVIDLDTDVEGVLLDGGAALTLRLTDGSEVALLGRDAEQVLQYLEQEGKEIDSNDDGRALVSDDLTPVICPCGKLATWKLRIENGPLQYVCDKCQALM